MKTMFKNVLLIALLAISTLSFSQRVLTDEERESLKNHGEFLFYCEWAVRNHANYLQNRPFESLTTKEAAIRWSKDYQISTNITIGGIHDAQLTVRFLDLGKGIQLNLGAAPQPAETIIAAWNTINNNKFEELAPQYFILIGDGINFSVGN